jgi:hypothetical protein
VKIGGEVSFHKLYYNVCLIIVKKIEVIFVRQG